MIELTVVVAIISILAVALGFQYAGWQGAYKVERETKNLYTDLMDGRARAITRNRFYFADFNTPAPAAGRGAYRVIEDTNNNGASNPGAGDDVLAARTEYVLSTDAGGTLTFSARGVISTPQMPSVIAASAVCFTTTADPDFDCIVLEQTRINIGKLATQISAGGGCNAANCITK